jgi:hypothetical protein
MRSETLQAAVVRGEAIDQEQFVRLGNGLVRGNRGKFPGGGGVKVLKV